MCYNVCSSCTEGWWIYGDPVPLLGVAHWGCAIQLLLPHRPTSAADQGSNGQWQQANHCDVQVCDCRCNNGYDTITRHHIVLIYTIPIDFQPSSDGMGRTGAFICMHHELERLKVEGVVDIFQCIKASRMSRPYLVQNVVSPTANHHYIIIPLAVFMSLLSPPSPHTTSISSLPLILPYPI